MAKTWIILLALVQGPWVIPVVAPIGSTGSAVTEWVRAGVTAQQTLTITVPSSRDYGATFPGATVGGSVGTIRVRDFRGPGIGTWVATVSSTAFVTGDGGPAQTIANSRASYWSGPATRITGGGTVVPGQPTSASAQTLGVPRTAFSRTSGPGNNVVEWIPTLSIAVPVGVTNGQYQGRLTHSVA